MRKSIIVGNWKMNGSSAQNKALVSAIIAAERKGESAVCVPFPYLEQVKNLTLDSSVGFGAQDVSVHESGAYTGEVSASMLKDMGCHYVIVGHSERRTHHQESSQMVAQKAQQVIDHGMCPIICIGERLEERESGSTKRVLKEQLTPLLTLLATSGMIAPILAYEPVWAIGTGLVATVDQVADAHHFIRQEVAKVDAVLGDGVRILYGGSLKPENAEAIFAIEDVDGGLIGGASLDAASFLSLIEQAR